MQEGEKRRITRSATQIGLLTLLSRILGLIRDGVIAWFFGATMITDAFIVAFRIPNLFRKLFADGSLSITFITTFTEHIHRYGKQDAFAMALDVLKGFVKITIVISIAGFFITPVLIKVIAPGFDTPSPQFEICTSLMRIMMPYIGIICIMAICMGILNVLDNFAIPALTPAVLNLTMIASVVFISSHLTSPIYSLAIGVSAGGIFQLAIQVPALRKKGFTFRFNETRSRPASGKIGFGMIATVIGASVYHINILVGTVLASSLSEGSISYLYYADRIVQFPMGLFVMAISTATLPDLARQAHLKDMQGVSDTLTFSIKMVFFLTVPSMVGLMVLHEPIVMLLFQRGMFDMESTRQTAVALFFFGFGLWAFSGGRIIASVFFALQEVKLPLIAALISMSINLVSGLFFMRLFGHVGIALAAAVSSSIHFLFLAGALKIRIKQIEFRYIAKSACKSLLCSAIMGIIIWKLSRGITFGARVETVDLLLRVCGCILLGMVIYGVFSTALHHDLLKRGIKLMQRGV